MRSLTPEEAELWARVAATIRPLSRGQIGSSASAGGTPAKLIEGAEKKAAGPLRYGPAATSPPVREKRERRSLTVATLDSSWDRRMRSASIEPDRVLELHGRNLDQAWRAIDAALDRAVMARERIILLITGHPRPGDPPVGRGRIRSAVFDWLAASPHARNIAAVRPAHRRHGGPGSLYIILRRSRS